MKYERERERGGGVMHSLIIQDVLKEIWVALQRIQESYIQLCFMCTLPHLSPTHKFINNSRFDNCA